MSIASRITSIEDHIEDDYNALTRLGADLTNVDKNIENIASVVNSIYDKLPKVTVTGSSISLTPTLKGGMNIMPLGNCEQTGTPTPDNPIDIKVVTGDNNVVVQNKNIFDSEIEQGGINTDTGADQSSYSYVRCNYVKVIGGETISVKYKNDLVERGQVVIYEYDKDKNYLGFHNGNAKSYTRTLLNNTVFIRLRLEGENPAQVTSFSEIQVEYSDTPTSYIEHQEQSYILHLGSLELCKIGDYQDVITGTKYNWKVVRKVRHLSLAIADMDNNESYPGWKIPDNAPVMVDDLNLTSTNTYVDNITSYYSNIIKQATGSQNIRINNTSMWLPTGVFNLTQNQWKEQYPNLIFELYYGIANEQAQYEETITDTTLINELNGLQELLSYDGTTNITITSDTDNAQMLAQVSALKGE